MTKPVEKTNLKYEMTVDSIQKYGYSHHSDPELEQQLFQAAKDRFPEKIEEILQQGISPNIRDVQGRTPLHWAMALDCPCNTCIENAESCLVVILNSPETDTNIQDKEGQTPVHIAAENQLELCLRLMIYKFGANVYLRNKEGDQAIKLVAKKCPNVMKYILDRSLVIERGDSHSEKCVLKVDFRPVVGGDEPLYHKSVCGKVRKRPHNELDLLRSLLTSSKFARQKILSHPAVGVFLEQKWRRVRRTFIASFFGYVFWLLLYTGYILYVYLIKCPCRLYLENMRPNSIIEDSTEPQHDSAIPDVPPSLTVAETECAAASEFNSGFFILLTLTCIMSIYEGLKIIITPRLYFRSYLNILHWILLFMVMATFIPTFSKQSKLESVQYQLASFTIFLAWSLILSQIGKFPTVGKYMEIFGHVLRHFWSFLLTYCSLFVGFALAFSILFPGDKPYTIFPFAFLKIFVMMVGEMEYQEMFYSEQREEASGPLVGHFLYATFVIVVAIVLMNLLVGLTVSDIQGLQKEAELSRLSRQIVDMFHLESFMYSDKVPKFCKKACHKMTSVVLPLDCEVASSPHASTKSHGEPLLTHKYWFSFLPNDTRDISVTERLKSHALHVAVKTKAELKAKVCEKRKCYIGKYKLNFNVKEDDGADGQ